MKAIAVIPARGGSVGLPGKNVRPMNGVPLVGRAVLAAIGSQLVSDVYVSSKLAGDPGCRCGVRRIKDKAPN